jgi:hypothetical protein
MKDVYHPTYDDLHQASVSIGKIVQLRYGKPDIILGLARGGLLPATILSHYFNIPLHPISYSAKDGNGDNKNHNSNINYPLTDKFILIVDDICDSGKTLKDVYTYYMLKPGNTIITATLYFKIQNPQLTIPHVYHTTLQEDAPWVIFPFETNLV